MVAEVCDMEKGRKGRVNNKSNEFKTAYERLCLFTAQRRSFLYFGQPAHAKSLQLGMFPLVAMPYLCRMNTLNFFTTFRPTLAGAWIPAVFMVLVQLVCMAIFKEGGKRAVDTSWYDAKTRMYAQWNSIFQVLVIILAVFVPFKCGTMWFTVGTVIYAVAFVLFMWSFHSYGTADRDYKRRVPRYFLFF